MSTVCKTYEFELIEVELLQGSINRGKSCNFRIIGSFLRKISNYINILWFKKLELSNGKKMHFFRITTTFPGKRKSCSNYEGFWIIRVRINASSLYLIRKDVSADLCPSDQLAKKFKEPVTELACNKKLFKTK